VFKFYIRGSVQRNFMLKKSNKMQQYADIYLLLNYCICFGHPSRPSSRVYKSLVAASGTDHAIWGANLLKRLRIFASQIVRPIPDAASTVLCTADDRRDGRPKHVQ